MPKQPQPVALDSSRRSVHEIFEGVSRNAREELNRSSRALAFSGLAGGVTMGLTGLAVAIAQAVLGSGQPAEFISYLFYPVGFIAVIIGRAQLFTENTLYPVVLVLDEHKHLGNTLRLWGVVFISNVVKDEPDPPQPPGQQPPAPVEEPPDSPQSDPPAPVREPGPTPPTRMSSGTRACRPQILCIPAGLKSGASTLFAT